MYEKAAKWLKESSRIVFFTGAGASTESGIPDFRGENGLYYQGKFHDYPPEVILSRNFFNKEPELFYEFYKKKILLDNILPNKCHRTIKDIETEGKMVTVITQNIDGLHAKAGSRDVLELHGSVYRNYCIGCGKKIPYETVLTCINVPCCDSCGNIVRPDVVLYEEMLDEESIDKAIKAISNCDLLFVIGTSLSVFPAAALINYNSNNKMILINKEKTAYDHKANIIFNESCGKVMESIFDHYRRI